MTLREDDSSFRSTTATLSDGFESDINPLIWNPKSAAIDRAGTAEMTVRFDHTTIFWSDDNYLVRPARDAREFVLWWKFMKQLKWNRGFWDLETWMHPTVECNMLLLIEKASNKIIGHVGAAIYDNSVGWIYAFVIAEKYRGKGLGRPLFKAAQTVLEKCEVQTIGLDGVPMQKGTYERRGFVASTQGEVLILDRPLVAKQPLPGNAIDPSHIVLNIFDIPLPLLVQHELKYTGFQRSRLWNRGNLFDRIDVEGFAVVTRDDPQTVDDIRAWVLLRRCEEGSRIGPLYADDVASARTALAKVMEAADDEYNTVSGGGGQVDWPHEKIIEDCTLSAEVWGGNPHATKLFEELGWRRVGMHYHRMWLNDKAPPEQRPGQEADKHAFAWFDAATG